MGVRSVRFNTEEETALKALTEALHLDTSSVIKRALWELYEELQDKAAVEAFEAREASGNTTFASIDHLLASEAPESYD